MSEQKGSVLLMDDEDMVCEIAEQIFNYLGYSVHITNDGTDAIEAYTSAFQGGTPYNLVIMDLNIPGGVGGKEAVGDILAVDPDAKVIVSSGFLNDPVMVKPGDYGFAGKLSKPFEISSIEELLKDFS